MTNKGIVCLDLSGIQVHFKNSITADDVTPKIFLNDVGLGICGIAWHVAFLVVPMLHTFKRVSYSQRSPSTYEHTHTYIH